VRSEGLLHVDDEQQRADLLVERIFDAPATDATCAP
jgi:hypothetical protein